MDARLDGAPCQCWTALRVSCRLCAPAWHCHRGRCQSLCGSARWPCCAEYLGSRSTFILGRFGGHAGRVLRVGTCSAGTPSDSVAVSPEPLPQSVIPRYAQQWEIGVLYGPHGAPDFFLAADIATFFATAWKVHYNSDRTGVRLIGPKPRWARQDGGEGGFTPFQHSRHAYAIGAIDYTAICRFSWAQMGRVWVALCARWSSRTPSCGRWGSSVPVTSYAFGGSQSCRRARWMASWKQPSQRYEGTCRSHRETLLNPPSCVKAAGRSIAPRETATSWSKIGPHVLDMTLRLRVHVLEEALRRACLPVSSTSPPGMRSLQVHYDSRRLRRGRCWTDSAPASAVTSPGGCRAVRACCSISDLLGRSSHAAGDAQVHASVRRTHRGAEQYRVHSPHQWAAFHR